MIDRFIYRDGWQDVKDVTMTTIGKTTGKYPDGQWKKKMLLAEHSPIRQLNFRWRWKELPYWVASHFVRHRIGIDPYMGTQRTDRTGIDRNNLPQGALVTLECSANAQAIINISRKRLCRCASKETRQAWGEIKEEIKKMEPELASCMVPECVYRGFCPEVTSCGYVDTDNYKKELDEYRRIPN